MSALTDRPARLLLRLHLRRSGGMIRLEGPDLDARLWVRGQVLCGAQGVPGLFGELAGRIPDPRALKGDLLADIPVLLAMGIGLDEASTAAVDRIGMLLAEATLDPEVQAHLNEDESLPPGSFPVGSPLLRAFAAALPKAHRATEIADELAGWSNSRIRVEDASGEELGALGPIALRTLALARRNRILGDLVRESGRGQIQRTQQAWLAVDLLRQLGLLRVPGAPPSQKHRTAHKVTSGAGEEPREAQGRSRSKTEPSGPPAERYSRTPEPKPPRDSPPPEREAKPKQQAPPPQPQAAEKSPAPRPPRGSTRRRMPSGLAAFAASAGEQEDHESIEIESTGGGAWSSRLSALDLSGPMAEDTDKLWEEPDQDGQTEPLPDMDFSGDEVSVDFEGDPDSVEPELLNDSSMTGPMEMGEFEEDYEDLEEEDEEQDLFGEPEEDDDSAEMAFGEIYEEEEGGGTDPIADVLDPEELDSSDLGFLIEEDDGLGQEPLLLGDPRDQPTQEEDGFALDDVTPEDPALPGLRRRLKQLRTAPPLQALGMNDTELVEHLWLRSELVPTWQRARAPWLPENWRSASPAVQTVAAEVLELLDETHSALQSAPVFAQALQRSWDTVPKRKSRTADALVLRAQRLCAGAKWDEALTVLEAARSANPSSPQALLLQLFARVVTRQMAVSDAVAWVYAVSQHTPDERLRAQGAYTAGRLLERNSKTADALACYRSAEKAVPQHKPTRARLTHLAEAAPGAPSALGRLFLDVED